MQRHEIIGELQGPEDVGRAIDIYSFVDKVRFISWVIRISGFIGGGGFFLLLPHGGGWKWELAAFAISLATGFVATGCARAAFGSARRKLVAELGVLLESGQGYVLVLTELTPEDFWLNCFLQKYLPKYAEYD
ncbi:MAG: hypothetical protein HYT39_02720 [Candidatus Sungbacteria bacterium]|nr:hypothetical protein [Candidatus Sungbacteria bacterium]